MKFLKPIVSTTVFGIAMLAACNLCAPAAWATYSVTLTQQGSNVVATGSGTLNLAGLNLSFSESGVSFVTANIGEISIGPTTLEPIDVYEGFTGPKNFGTGGILTASSGSGDAAGIGGFIGELFVPHSYVSGTSLSDTATWDNQTFTTLGVTPGNYTWTWGSGASADSFMVDIKSTVPEPSSFVLLALALGILALFRARSCRQNSFPGRD